MFEKSQLDIEFQKQIEQQKGDLNNTFKKSFAEQEAVQNLFINSINHCNYNNFVDDKIIWNAAGYINLISLDLKHFVRDLAFADDEWGKRIYARMISVLIYESLNDLLEILGKEFRGIITKLSNSVELTSELKSLSKRLNEFKSKNIERLKEIRNVATAHRDQNILAQLNLIATIGWSELFEIGFSYNSILNDLGLLMQKVIKISVIEFKR